MVSYSSIGLSIVGIGFMLFLWGYDKVTKDKYHKFNTILSWVFLLIGFIYIVIGFYIFII